MIFKVHLKSIKVSNELDIQKLAAQLPDLPVLISLMYAMKAALIAARNNKKQVEMPDFQDAIDRVIGGLEKKNKIISEDERRLLPIMNQVMPSADGSLNMPTHW
jgi:cell division protease FtsH